MMLPVFMGDLITTLMFFEKEQVVAQRQALVAQMPLHIWMAQLRNVLSTVTLRQHAIVGLCSRELSLAVLQPGGVLFLKSII